MERSFQGLSIAVETVRIVEELVEIWPNEVCDIWDHTVDLKETFKPQKRKIYPLFKNEREEVQNFVNN